MLHCSMELAIAIADEIRVSYFVMFCVVYVRYVQCTCTWFGLLQTESRF